MLRLLFLLLAAAPAWAQPFPNRPITIINPTAAGASTDVLIRAMAPALSQRLGQPVVVVNREGGSSSLGTALVARAAPDGYTLWFGAAYSLSVLPVIRSDTGYTAASLEPVCQAFVNTMVVAVRPDSPFTSLGDYIARARQGNVTFGHQGIASIPHLAMVELGQVAGVALQDIPYRGDPPVLVDTLAGRVDAGALVLGSLRGQALRPLAVFGAARHPDLPDVPTVREAGWDVAPESFGGIFAPAGLPAPVRATLAAACEAGVADPAYREAARRGFQPEDLYLGPEALAARLQRDVAAKARLLRGITLER
jgi:tripartite-type tricarboxylate transporter receptor subunit TctC